jgi:hypothetical protein
MKMKFDKDKCLKLLKERKSLQKEGKLLRDYDKAKNDELISYLIMVEDQIFWESRKEYIQMLDLFVSKKITLDHFFTQFCGLRGSNLKSSRMWKNNLEEEASGIWTQSNKIDFQLNPESGEFTKIISNLHSWTDLYDPDITLEMNLKQPELIGYGISEEFLRFIIEEDFLPQLEKYCKES